MRIFTVCPFQIQRMSFMTTKFHEILLSGFKEVAMNKKTKQSNTPGQTE